MFHKRHPPAGSRPGVLVIPPDSPPPRIRVMDYTNDRLEERELVEVDALAAFRDSESVTWIDVQGLGDEAILRRLAALFSLHPLALEDIVNVPQRPKVEVYDEHEFVVTRMVALGNMPAFDSEQLSLVIGERCLLTFQERYGDVLDPVRARIRRGGGPIRRLGADYLAYAILDAVIDGYYPVLEAFGEHLEALEVEVATNPTAALLHRIYESKRQLLALRRAIWPQREAVNTMVREELQFVSAPVRVYLRDCYDHAVQIIDVVETYRELAGNLMDLYLSTISNRTNDVMKVLTVMASIFIPLTFIAGIYGMNFEYMPELHSRWAYPAVWLLMLCVAGGMFIYFRRRGWLGSDVPRAQHRATRRASRKRAPPGGR